MNTIPETGVECDSATVRTLHWSRVITITLAALAAVYTLGIYSSATRPIWIDEFLHYALGSHRSTAEAWKSISDTLPNINHGQTGVHMMIDYWLLNAFGASSFWLRLPSLMAGAFLLFSALRIGFRLGFGPLWSVFLVGMYFGNENLMHFVGEARPYMPLAAAVTGTFAFYLEPQTERTLISRLLGATAISLGVLMHPFFPVYWLAVAIFGFLYIRGGGLLKLIPDFARFCDIWISIPASLVFICLAKLTWLRGSPEFQYDPFEWIRAAGLINTFTRVSHFQFLGACLWFGIGILIIAALALLIPRLRCHRDFRRIVPPLLLIALALLISLFLSYLSYRRNYWILPRQWVASMALVCFGFTWFMFELSRFLSTIVRYGHILCILAMGVVISQTAPSLHRARSKDLVAWVPHQSEAVVPIDPAVALKLPQSNDEWVAAANANIRAGGPVWPLFRKYYGRND